MVNVLSGWRLELAGKVWHCRASAAECQLPSADIDHDSRQAERCRTDQPVERLACMAAAGDHKCRLLPKLCLAQFEAVQPHLFAVKVADHIRPPLNCADFQIRDRPRRSSRKEEDRRCPGIHKQMRRDVIHLCIDDR